MGCKRPDQTRPYCWVKILLELYEAAQCQSVTNLWVPRIQNHWGMQTLYKLQHCKYHAISKDKSSLVLQREDDS